MELFGNQRFSTRAMGELCCYDPHFDRSKVRVMLEMSEAVLICSALFVLLFFCFSAVSALLLAPRTFAGPGYELFRWGRHHVPPGHQLHIL